MFFVAEVGFPSRIVLVISSLESGGAERVASLLASAWAEQGRAVTLLTTFLSEVEADFYPLSHHIHRVRLAETVNVHRRSLRDSWRRALEFRRIIQSAKPDVVISFMDRVNVLTLLCLIGTRIPVIACERSNPFLQTMSWYWELLRRVTYRRLATTICCQTTRVAKDLESKWQIPSVALSNPLTNDIPNGTSPLLTRPRTILSVGRMTLEKGHDLLLRSWAFLAPSYPDWTLRMVGDGELGEDLHGLALQLGIAERVEWAGKVREIWSEYQNAQIFVLPSRYEGFPNALLEAMAMGCACVSTDCENGPAEMIEHGSNGLLCEVENVEALSSAIQQFLDSRELLEFCGKSSASVREKFSLTSHLQGWERIFAQL